MAARSRRQNTKEERRLLEACRHGELSLVKQLYNQHKDARDGDFFGYSPLHHAARGGRLEIVSFLLEQSAEIEAKDHSGRTPLHIAVEYGNTDVVEYLLTEGHCDPNCTTNAGETPLALTENTVIIWLLLQNKAKTTDLYKYRYFLPHGSPRQAAPSAIAVFMVGDKGTGKTTLTTALNTEKEGLSRLAARWSKVGGVKHKTAGMECHQVHSKRVGNLTIFDLAGHREFHGSHDTVIRSAVSGPSSGIFLFVIDLTKTEDELQRTVHYWLSFMKNQVTGSSHTHPHTSMAHLLVIGSHGDAVKSKRELQEKQRMVKILCQSVEKLHFVDFVTVDCRYSESTALDQVRAHILQSHNTLQCTTTMSFNVHCFHVYLISKCGKIPGLQLGVVFQTIRHDIQCPNETYMKFLPQDLSSLREVCNDLNRRGIMLFIEKKELQNSWIIVDRDMLLREVNGTLFAPKDFVEHKELTYTGVVPCSKLCTVFKEILHSKKADIELLFSFMQHMEFCQEITEKEILQLVVDQHPQYKKERHFLFPALTSPVPPDDLWTPHPDITYSTHTSGWVLQCCGPQDYLSPRFLQVLLLRLTFTHALPVDAHESDPANPGLQQACTIWRKGIYWTTTSCVDVLVEISDRKVTLLLRCKKNKEIKLVKIRAKVITEILKVKEEFCPSTETVELFVPNPQYPVSTELAVSSSKLAHSLSFDEESVVVKSHTPIDIIDLLYFEPYLYLNKQCLVDLYCTSNKIDAEFIDNASGCVCVTNFCKVFDHFCTVLNVPPHKVTADGRSSDYHKAERMFHIWMTQSEGTFECLRKEMDKYSVFSGRNTFDVAYTPPTPATSAEHDTSKEQVERDDSC